MEDELLEVEIKQNIDSNLCSMGKEKKGRDPDKLSPAAKKEKEWLKLERKRNSEKNKKKLKPLSKSGLGSKSPV